MKKTKQMTQKDFEKMIIAKCKEEDCISITATDYDFHERTLQRRLDDLSYKGILKYYSNCYGYYSLYSALRS